jgi:hypothetical protein
MIAFPRRHLGSLQELAAGVLDRHGRRYKNDVLARDLLAGFVDLCLRAGLDGVLFELEQAFPPLEITDGSGLSEEPALRSALVARLGDALRFNPGGPRSVKLDQLAECLIGVLSLTVTVSADRTLTFSDDVRRAIRGALAGVVERELAVPQVRAAIVAAGRNLCEARYIDAFDRMSQQLDERGSRMPAQPRMPLAAVQAVQRALFDARVAVVERAAHAAIDRAAEILATVSAEAAERIDQPITHRLTPRDVAVTRASDERVRTPEAVVGSLLESLTELAELAWLPAEPTARAYRPTETFAVGDLLDHAVFGRGTVRAASPAQIEVEFSESCRTLVHARSPR